MQKLSRRKIADYVAGQYAAGAPLHKLVKQVAAHLVETGRTRESELVTRAILDALAARGIVAATVTAAHPLSQNLEQSIKQMLGRDVRITTVVDPLVLGGVRIESPGQQLDTTLLRNITAIRAAKI